MSNNLDSFVIVDPDSGTYFGANNAILLDTTLFTDSDSDLFINGTNGDRGDLAVKLGVYLHDNIEPSALHYEIN